LGLQHGLRGTGSDTSFGARRLALVDVDAAPGRLGKASDPLECQRRAELLGLL